MSRVKCIYAYTPSVAEPPYLSINERDGEVAVDIRGVRPAGVFIGQPAPCARITLPAGEVANLICALAKWKLEGMT